MDNIETLNVNLPDRPKMADTLICVDPVSRSFLSSQPLSPVDVSFAVFDSADEIFDILWSGDRIISSVVLDMCQFDLEELFFASLNHPDVLFIVRSPLTIDEVWRQRLTKQPNISLPCSDFMVWNHVISGRALSMKPEIRLK